MKNHLVRRRSHNLLRQNVPLDLFSVLIEDLRPAVGQTLLPPDQHPLFAGLQGGILIASGGKGKRLVVLQDLPFHACEPDGHAVIGQGIRFAGEHVGVGERNIQGGQHIGHSASVGAYDNGFAALLNGNHLDAVNGNLGNPVACLCGVGV